MAGPLGYWPAIEESWEVNYNDLKSLLASAKTPLAVTAPSDSFHVPEVRNAPYVEPSFDKIIFDEEKPSVVLISAVGATGKTALASALSFDTRLPILDLAKHKPVGDNTLTGLLTTAYDVKHISAILQGLASGTFGIIIDGLDEGYSKTTAKAFEAFLDDVAARCRGAPRSTFVVLGRSRTIEQCWSYLVGRNVTVGLVSITPFSLESARRYVDLYTEGLNSPHRQQYAEARDYVLSKLQSAFNPSTGKGATDFLSFIGYPPVLDAVATLLRTEKNFHSLVNSFTAEDANVEVGLLHNIANYILVRERNEKVLANIVRPLTETAPAAMRSEAIARAFLPREQCLRLLSHCLGEPLSYPAISDSALNALYERQLETFLPEHPFLRNGDFRNAVFEAVAIATLIDSSGPSDIALITRYTSTRKHSYHLVYMTHLLAQDKLIPADNLKCLIAAAMEFRSVHSEVNIAIEGSQGGDGGRIQVDIEIALNKSEDLDTYFSFESDVTPGTILCLGSELEAAYVSLPCAVLMAGADEIELTAPVEIEAQTVTLAARSLVLKAHRKEAASEVSIVANSISSSIEQISPNDVQFSVALNDLTGVTYPVVQYVARRRALPSDPELNQKYFRLKRILMEFRSHSKGALARYKGKIEHQRVLKNDVGRRVLERLIADGVLSLRGSFYYVNPDAQGKHLGINWQDLRRGQPSEALLAYLRSI
jgi:hypothetical protein